jgi:hypothetical protein
MPDRPPIPEPIWRKVLAFLAEGKTGQVTLYVAQGRVIDAALEERIRAARVVESPQSS